MKKKILLTLSLACILCSCGQIDSNDAKAESTNTDNNITTTTTTVQTTTLAQETIIESTPNISVIEHNGQEYAIDINDEIKFEDYGEFYAKLVERHGDAFNIPNFDKDKYTFKYAKFYELSGSYLISLKDENGNTIRYNGHGTNKATVSVKDEYESTLKDYVPWSGSDVVLREDLNGYFCEFDTDKGNYWFSGIDKYGYDFYADFYSNDYDASIEVVEQAMRDFGIEFTET